MKNYIYIRQEDSMDCGIASLATILLYYNKTYTLDYLKEIAEYDHKIGTSFLQLYNIAIKLGFKAIAMSLENIDSLNYLELPCIAQIQNSANTMHFVVIYEFNLNTVIIADPAKGIRKLTFDQFKNCFTKKILLISLP